MPNMFCMNPKLINKIYSRYCDKNFGRNPNNKNRQIKYPFPKKIRDKDTMQKYLDADEKLSTVSLKIDYYDTMLVYLESILKVIQNRTYQIKNAIEFMRFQSGLG